MWVRKILAVLLLGLFVLGIFAVADARMRPPSDRLNPPPTGGDPEDDPWGRIEATGTTKIIGVIFINNIPMVVEVKEEVAVKKITPFFEAKRGK